MSPEHEAASHLTAEELSAYLDGALDGAAKRRVLEHVEACATCRQTLTAAAGALADSTEAPPLRWLGPLIAAAAIAALILVPAYRGTVSVPAQPVVRGESSGEVAHFAAVTPRDDEVIRGRPGFEWVAAGEGASYELVLTDDVGDVVWSARTLDTRLVLPEDITLAPGRYRWVVDALLDQAEEATTGAHTFRVER